MPNIDEGESGGGQPAESGRRNYQASSQGRQCLDFDLHKDISCPPAQRAMEAACQDIAPVGTPFAQGFLVVESAVRLDVVAVYTAKNIQVVRKLGEAMAVRPGTECPQKLGS